MTTRCSSYTCGRMITLLMPVSSSSVRKTKPLAVPGRCRVMTHPAMRTRWPGRWRGRSMARSTPRRASDARWNVIGCAPIVSPVPAKSAAMRSTLLIAGNGLPPSSFVIRPSSFVISKSSPSGRTALSICQSAARRSYPNEASAPISASTASSLRRTPVLRIRSSTDENLRAVSSGCFQSCAHWLQKHTHHARAGCWVLGATSGASCCVPGAELAELKFGPTTALLPAACCPLPPDAISSIDASSHPHFGHRAGGGAAVGTTAAIARPTGSRRPAT